MTTPVKARQSAMATSKKAGRSGELAICSPNRSARHPSVPPLVVLLLLLLLLLPVGRPCFPGNMATPQREQARQRPARQRRAPRQPYASNQKLARGAITKVPTPLKIMITTMMLFLPAAQRTIPVAKDRRVTKCLKMGFHTYSQDLCLLQTDND